jgi:hypothetical protein
MERGEAIRSPFLIDADDQLAPDYVGAGNAQFLGRVEVLPTERGALDGGLDVANGSAAPALRALAPIGRWSAAPAI